LSIADFDIPEDIKAFLRDNADRVWIVGGAVRDLILGREPADYDFLITDVAEEEMDDLLGRAERAGEHFPVYLWQGVEFTRTSSSFPWSDLKRRDFTINSLAVKLAGGRIYDPQGGFYDLENKLLQPLPGAFSRDAHRFYRALRFISQLPEFDLTEHCYNKLADMEEKALAEIFPERVAEEFKLVLTAECGERFFFLLDELDISSPHFSWLETDLQRSLKRWRAVRQLSDHPKLLFAALALDTACKRELQGVHDILPLPKKWYRAAELAAKAVEEVRNWQEISPAELAETLAGLKTDVLNLQECVLLARASSRIRHEFRNLEQERRYYHQLLALNRDLNDAVKGHDLLNQMCQGPELGRELLDRRKRWLERNREEYHQI